MRSPNPLEANIGGVDEDVISLSPESQNSLDEIIKQHNPKTGSENNSPSDKKGISNEEKANEKKEVEGQLLAAQEDQNSPQSEPTEPTKQYQRKVRDGKAALDIKEALLKLRKGGSEKKT